MMLLSRWRAELPPVAQGALFYLGYYGALAVYSPFLTVFYAHQGLSGSEIGLLSALGPLVSLLVAPTVAALADRQAWRKRLLSGLLAATALCLLAFPVAGSFVWLLPVVVLLAVFFSPNLSIADGLIAPMAARHGLAYGKMRLWGSLSWAVIAAIGGALWQQVGLFYMFPVSCLLFLGTIVVVQLLHEERAREAPPPLPARAVLADGRFRTVLLTTFLAGISMSMVGTFSGPYMDRLSGQGLVGLFSAVAALCEAPTMLLGERVMRRIGGAPTLLVGYSLLTVAWLLLALVQQPAVVLVAAAVRGFGYGLFMPTTVRLVAGWAPAGRSATYLGLLNAGLSGLGPLIAGLLGGSLYDSTGAQAVFLLCTAAAGLAALGLGLAQVGGVFRPTATPPELARTTLTQGE